MAALRGTRMCVVASAATVAEDFPATHEKNEEIQPAAVDEVAFVDQWGSKDIAFLCMCRLYHRSRSTLKTNMKTYSSGPVGPAESRRFMWWGEERN